MAIIVTHPEPGMVQVRCEECGLHLFPERQADTGKFKARHPHPDDWEDNEENRHMREWMSKCPNKGVEVEGEV